MPHTHDRHRRHDEQQQVAAEDDQVREDTCEDGGRVGRCGCTAWERRGDGAASSYCPDLRVCAFVQNTLAIQALRTGEERGFAYRVRALTLEWTIPQRVLDRSELVSPWRERIDALTKGADSNSRSNNNVDDGATHVRDESGLSTWSASIFFAHALLALTSSALATSPTYTRAATFCDRCARAQVVELGCGTGMASIACYVSSMLLREHAVRLSGPSASSASLPTIVATDLHLRPVLQTCSLVAQRMTATAAIDEVDSSLPPPPPPSSSLTSLLRDRLDSVVRPTAYAWGTDARTRVYAQLRAPRDAPHVLVLCDVFHFTALHTTLLASVRQIIDSSLRDIDPRCSLRTSSSTSSTATRVLGTHHDDPALTIALSEHAPVLLFAYKFRNPACDRAFLAELAESFACFHVSATIERFDDDDDDDDRTAASDGHTRSAAAHLDSASFEDDFRRTFEAFRREHVDTQDPALRLMIAFPRVHVSLEGGHAGDAADAHEREQHEASPAYVRQHWLFACVQSLLTLSER